MQFGENLFVYSISVNAAALLLAIDIGHHEGTPYTEKDARPFWYTSQDPTVRKEVADQTWYSLGRVIQIEPIGLLEKERNRIRDALIDSIKSGAFKPDQIRREISGEVNAAETFLDTREIETWAFERKIETGDFWADFVSGEEVLVSRLSRMVAGAAVQ